MSLGNVCSLVTTTHNKIENLTITPKKFLGLFPVIVELLSYFIVSFKKLYLVIFQICLVMFYSLLLLIL